jgi:hypothetical protein
VRWKSFQASCLLLIIDFDSVSCVDDWERYDEHTHKRSLLAGKIHLPAQFLSNSRPGLHIRKLSDLIELGRFNDITSSDLFTGTPARSCRRLGHQHSVFNCFHRLLVLDLLGYDHDWTGDCGSQYLELFSAGSVDVPLHSGQYGELYSVVVRSVGLMLGFCFHHHHFCATVSFAVCIADTTLTS